jgi:hypothetical protein
MFVWMNDFKHRAVRRLTYLLERGIIEEERELEALYSGPEVDEEPPPVELPWLAEEPRRVAHAGDA